MLVQIDGQDVVAAKPGDIVMIPPYVRHWHSASSDGAMEHFAIVEAVNGTAVTCMEKLTEEEI